MGDVEVTKMERLAAALNAIIEGPPKNILECETAAWMYEVAVEAMKQPEESPSGTETWTYMINTYRDINVPKGLTEEQVKRFILDSLDPEVISCWEKIK